MVTEIGDIRITVIRKRSRFRRTTLKYLNGFLLLKSSHIISEGQGAISKVQF